VERADRRLQHVRTSAAKRHRAVERLLSPVDLLTVPERAVLLGEEHDLLAGEASLPSRVVEQHQGQEPVNLRLVRHQLRERASQPDRLRREVTAAAVALVEDQIDHGQHRREPIGEQVGRGDAERDAGGLDLVLGADQPLRHRRLRDEEGAGDLLGGETAERSERESHLGLERERRMTAGEEQLQPLVGDLRFLQLVLHRFRAIQQPVLLGQGSVAADPVDRPVARRGHQPGPRVLGRPVPRPALRRDRERFLSGLLGELEAPEEADQAGEDAAPLLSEDPV
jgi:hypothetical protein